MSDPYGSFEDNPYGAAPYGGQQPRPPYPPQGGFPLQPPAPAKRPGNVLFAAVLTIVCAGIVGLLGVVIAVVTLAARDDVTREVAKDDRYADIDPDTVVAAAAGIGIGLALLSIAAIVAAAFVLRRSNAARITLLVLAIIAAILGLIAVGSRISLVITIAAIVVIVMLFTGDAGRWFRSKPTILPYSGYRS